ncbi:alpha-ketoglutarate-dependent dioxygenase AlkB [Chryseobacterium lactis]|uniref:alpha-ketoglutarate-dependent dioxygenase AlkB n=1 Tax=Chryseobacterium lactis TaxID=1241981 RepID=UPI0016265C1F|nr:alpha-ketoglutarate-dependent dioxygenase AlkB [Chryseobacterium lactis]
MNSTGFHKIDLHLENNLFNDLFHSTEFESTGKGRLGNHLVKPDGPHIPIVRTTTRYTIPATAFSEIHQSIVDHINETLSVENTDISSQNFNNALIEVYDAVYSKMGFHSDQALDLENNSFIALFTCYERPDELADFQLRKLVIKDKTTDEESEIILYHHSVVLFSLETNTKFQHKIVLNALPDPKMKVNDNKWLGITFRTSKTFVHFSDGQPQFSTGESFILADQEQESEFFRLRGQENRALDFTYPDLKYTISKGDLIMPKYQK